MGLGGRTTEEEAKMATASLISGQPFCSRIWRHFLKRKAPIKD